MENKFKKRMEEVKSDLEKSGKNVTNSKLYNSIQEKLSNNDKPIVK
ncbi:MAG: hypothetical protein ABFS32_20285 [Bacteroidota bacterium]